MQSAKDTGEDSSPRAAQDLLESAQKEQEDA